MKKNNYLALIAAYYLSKYDQVGYKNLNFLSRTDAVKQIGKLLGVNPNSVKNMRDEFDPIHDNPRVGWYQRPLRPSRVKVVELFQDLAEEELRDIVLEILTNPEFVSSDECADVITPISRRENKRKGKAVFIIRGPTGRKAEEAFIKYHGTTQEPVPGILFDRRDHGCGYDFEIKNPKGQIQVEVKGLDGNSGGVVFTSKEWNTASKNGNSYFLAIARNVAQSPTFQFIRNPANTLKPKKNIFTTVQVNWNITEAELLKS